LCRLHHGFDDIRANFLSHLAAGDGRKAVMETGADAGIGDLVGISSKIGKAMRDLVLCDSISAEI